MTTKKRPLEVGDRVSWETVSTIPSEEKHLIRHEGVLSEIRDGVAFVNERGVTFGGVSVVIAVPLRNLRRLVKPEKQVYWINPDWLPSEGSAGLYCKGEAVSLREEEPGFVRVEVKRGGGR